MSKTPKITCQVGMDRVQIVKLTDTYEIAILKSRRPSVFARDLQEALERMNEMVTALVWMRDMEAK